MKKEKLNNNASEERKEGQEEVTNGKRYFDEVEATTAAEHEGFVTNGSKNIKDINIIPEEIRTQCIEEKTFNHIHGKVIGRRLNEKGRKEIAIRKEKEATNGVLKFT